MHLFILQVIPETGADSTGVGENKPTDATKSSTVVQVPVNIFTGKLQGIIGFTSTHVRILVGDGHDSQEYFLYWKSTDIVVPDKSQDICELWRGILWRHEDKFTSSTGLVGDRFDTAG